MLQTRACTYDVIVFHSAVFDRPHQYDVCMRFRFDPLSRAFSHR